MNDTIYVVGWDQGASNTPPDLPTFPKDNYNGIIVAKSRRRAPQEPWNQFDADNARHQAADGRHLITILAPGVGVKTANPNVDMMGGDGFDNPPAGDGTSFAAPHVTGTIALLPEYAHWKVNQIPVEPHWAETTTVGSVTYKNPQRHEVMKAVVMNSADKIDSEGNAKKLMQTRWVYRADGETTWLTSTGHNETHPLDDQLGVGHLNARRALTQFQPGEWSPVGTPPVAVDVPAIAWDFGATTQAGSTTRYQIKDTIWADSYISVTLVWDRHVQDADNNWWYDPGEGLTNMGFTNMDLFVVPRGAPEAMAVARSVSTLYNVEHIFKVVGTEQKYDILVKQVDGGAGWSQKYALAWWTFPKPVPDPGGEGITLETAAYARGSDGGEGPSLFTNRIAEGLFEVPVNADGRVIDTSTSTPPAELPLPDQAAFLDDGTLGVFLTQRTSDVDPWNDSLLDTAFAASVLAEE